MFFTPFFTAVYIVERLVLHTVYVLNKKILQLLSLKFAVYNLRFIIKSGFKLRAGCNGVHAVYSNSTYDKLVISRRRGGAQCMYSKKQEKNVQLYKLLRKNLQLHKNVLHYQQETNVSAKGKDIQRKEKQKCESVTKE